MKHLDARFNPVLAAESVFSDYKSYLKSTFEFSDIEIRSEFNSAIEGQIALAAGPYIQSNPPYAGSQSVADLVAEGTLNSRLLELSGSALPVDRPLYKHQEQTIRKILNRRNLIIATGTGSGKTESFLLPIVNDLLNESVGKGSLEPGVRALLLYPMNALANDQMGRIRSLLAPYNDITFGRYIGDTKDKYEAARKLHIKRFACEPQPNELISREEMQKSPPHILVTNFSMLEFLLLRPDDHSFFDGEYAKYWKFVVLDEVHSYQGAQGAELSMLMRRVKDRVVGSEKGRIQFIGTSATLGGTNEEMTEIAEFGSSLFGEKLEFHETDNTLQDIILPEIKDLNSEHEKWSARPEAIMALAKVLETTNVAGDLVSIAKMEGFPDKPDVSVGIREVCGSIMVNESHVMRLRERLLEGAIHVKDAAQMLFNDENSVLLVENLLLLSTFGVVDKSGTPALGVKFHLMIRALEGVYRCFSPNHPKGKPRIQLKRSKECPECNSMGILSPLFELARCRSCGSHYIVGTKYSEESNSYLGLGEFFERKLRYFLAKENLIDFEDEDGSEEHQSADLLSPGEECLCTICGSIAEFGSNNCGHNHGAQLVLVGVEERDGVLHKCLSCSSSSGGPVVERILAAKDYPTSVIATDLYQQLPRSTDPNLTNHVGGGRKLLCFADSRTDAAWFAPYLENRYTRLLQRNLIVRELLEHNEPIDFETLVIQLSKRALDEILIDPDLPQSSRQRIVESWLIREVLATDRRQSLNGIGLVKIFAHRPNSAQPPEALQDLGFSEEESFMIMEILIGTVRESGAVRVPASVDISDQMFAPRNYLYEINYEKKNTKQSWMTGWIPKAGSNRRVDFLEKLFLSRGISAPVKEVLSSVWLSDLNRSGSPWSKLLSPRENHHGTTYALDYRNLLFFRPNEENVPYQCGLCRQVSWVSIDSICPTYRCKGMLSPLENVETKNYFYKSYIGLKPANMEVAEHTAQLTTTKAFDTQQDFIEGKINVLSCSTTFEVGVDVGDVQSVFMRNLPPSPANYVQRAGRAGRRMGAPALTVTYASRNSHDLYFYNRPLLMINGKLKPPRIQISNIHIVRRHIHAVAYAAFAKHWVESRNSLEEKWPENVEGFFLTTNNGKTVSEQMREWLESKPQELKDSLRDFVPLDLHGPSELGLEDWVWVGALYSEIPEIEKSGWMARAESDIKDEIVKIDENIQRLRLSESTDSDYARKSRARRSRNQLEDERNTIASQSLLGYLSRKVVLPKYGFPVDVIELDVRKGRDLQHATAESSDEVELSRDAQLGIRDYAPGSQSVAAKCLWDSMAIYIPPSKSLQQRDWFECSGCGAFWEPKNAFDSTCPVCGNGEKSKQGIPYVRPEFGFIGKKSTDKPGETRPSVIGFLQSFFSDFQGNAPPVEQIEVHGLTLEVRQSKQGRITVINRGREARGFMLCNECGFCKPAPTIKEFGKKNKKSTSSTKHLFMGVGPGDCKANTMLRHVSLGHWYLTDAVEIAFPSHLLVRENAQSVLSSLLAATPSLGIGQREMNGSVRPITGGNSLILFDTVPGGAGYATLAASKLEELFTEAVDVARRCPDCGLDSSCYGCLRTYQNQRHHESLERRLALDVFAKFPGLASLASKREN
jgi:hypothetical protein